MLKLHNLAVALLIAITSQISVADTIYGAQIKNASSAVQRTEFQKLADKTSAGGWEALRAGRLDDAKYRFNQAFLFDKSNGLALWGIAIIHAQKGEYKESLKNFEKAEPSLSDDLNFNSRKAHIVGRQ